mmetsp:Transcript_31885/g.85259  ORF Transcript_31885/g.85259 Transcript_31885/m.85259 type:complete len:216 (+) Transcript_31885:755-1402(+)
MVKNDHLVKLSTKLRNVLHEVVPLLPTELSMQDTRDWKIPFHSNVHTYWIHVVRKDHNLVVMAKLIEKLICEGPFHHLPSQSSVVLEMKNDLVQVQDQGGDVFGVLHLRQTQEPRFRFLGDEHVPDRIEPFTSRVVPILEGFANSVDGLAEVTEDLTESRKCSINPVPHCVTQIIGDDCPKTHDRSTCRTPSQGRVVRCGWLAFRGPPGGRRIVT